MILWRAGLRISEALALNEPDLEDGRGSLLVRRGKGRRRREVGMDEWGWAQLRPWLDYVYLQGIDNGEVIDTVRRRTAPMMPASAGLGL